MKRFLFPIGRKNSKLLSKSESQKRNAVSLPALTAADSDLDDKENAKPRRNPRSSLRKSMRRLRRTKSARKTTESKKKIDKQEISLPQNLSSIQSTSKESGYGSLSRKSTLLRPKKAEDIFTDASSSRLSNWDFPTDNGLHVEALWDHVTMEHDELGFKVGNVIRVLDMRDANWWWGKRDSGEGWFPATFVRILVNQHHEETGSDDATSQHGDEDNHEYTRVTTFDDDVNTSNFPKKNDVRVIENNNIDHKTSEEAKIPTKQPEIVISAAPTSGRRPSMTRDQMRKNVINEIVNSEKVFMRHLQDVIEGYLVRCRKRTDMFTDEQISIIFGNVEEIYEFQTKLFTELESAVNRSAIHATQIGKIFLKYKSRFTIYSEYCNNHPQSLALLSKLLNDKKYLHYFEACRLLQKMIGISLDGFLLTPVQKICKYPLQLAELSKYTHADHTDYDDVKSALEAMRNVAKMINERKRKMENIKKISRWQAAVLNWQGDDVLRLSKEIIHSSEVYIVSPTKGKTKLRVAFLFDYQLIICKKDILRKDLLYYKTRYHLDSHNISPIEEYPQRSSVHVSNDHSHVSGHLRFGWEIRNKSTNQSCIMLCKNEEDYKKWMKAFPLEREISLSNFDEESIPREEVLKNLLQATLIIPGKPKESSLSRSGSYRSRVKLSSNHGSPIPKHKLLDFAETEKSHGGGLFRSGSGRRSPFRRSGARESSFVF